MARLQESYDSDEEGLNLDPRHQQLQSPKVLVLLMLTALVLKWSAELVFVVVAEMERETCCVPFCRTLMMMKAACLTVWFPHAQHPKRTSSEMTPDGICMLCFNALVTGFRCHYMQ